MTRLSLAGLVALASIGCQHAATQVVVVVDSDMAPGVELRRVRVRLGRVGAATRLYDRTFEVRARAAVTTGSAALDDGVLIPGEIAITAGDPSDPRQLQVDVVALLSDERASFTQSVTVPFERETVRYLSMFLAGRCRIEANRQCASGQVCGASGCVSIAGLLSTTPPAADASLPTDAEAFRCTPGAAERCYDGVDNNCDGLVDEGCAPQSCADGGLGFEDVTWVSDAPGRYNSHCASELVAPTAPFAPSAADGGTSSLSPFRIDRYEVTVARFRRFASAALPAPPYQRVQYPSGAIAVTDVLPTTTRWPVEAPTTYAPSNRYCHWSAGQLGREDQPINCVDWFTAQAFCVWDGGRLPTEAEWEYTARAWPIAELPPSYTLPPLREYPFGTDESDAANDLRCGFNYDEPDCVSRTPTADVPYGTWPVTHTAHVEPWWQVFDLAGNVAEWTADVVRADGTACAGALSPQNPRCASPAGPLLFAAHGGGYQSLRAEVRAVAREGLLPNDKRRTLGFRCVRAP